MGMCQGCELQFWDFIEVSCGWFGGVLILQQHVDGWKINGVEMSKVQVNLVLTCTIMYLHDLTCSYMILHALAASECVVMQNELEEFTLTHYLQWWTVTLILYMWKIAFVIGS